MSTKLADDPATETAKKTLAEEHKASDKSRAEFVERTKGKPTPTQEENDIVALGGHILEHEDDGSAPDPNVAKTPEVENKHLEGDKSHQKPQNYQTRQQHSRSE
jgi:hypothetical protein